MLLQKETLIRLPSSPGCIICDNNSSNPRSLRLELLWDEINEMVCIPCEPDETWCGFKDVIHGGVIAAVLDEAMAWAIKTQTDGWAFTAECTIRYKKPVTPGESYVATGRIIEAGRRKILAQGEFLDTTGKVLAEASAIFLPAKGKAVPRSAE